MSAVLSTLIGGLAQEAVTKTAPPRSGRPINPNSARQRMLVYLDSQTEPCSTEQIRAALDLHRSPAAALCELEREGQITSCGRIGTAPHRYQTWKIAE